MQINFFHLMASLILTPAPSPAPSHSTWTSRLLAFLELVFDSKTDRAQLLRIEVSVLSTIVLLILLIIFGRSRRYIRFGFFFKHLTKIVYVLVPVSITYTMGLMHNAAEFHILYPFWACTLVYAYGGVTTMTACDFSDHENALRYFWHTLPLLFWTVWLLGLLSAAKVPNDGIHIPHPTPIMLGILFLYLLAAGLNTYETLKSFYIASKSKGLPSEVQSTVFYMDQDGGFMEEGPFNGYLVWGKPRDKHSNSNGNQGESVDRDDIITTTQISQLTGEFLPPNWVHKERLQDLCLSYAFFRLLLRRFADLPISETSKPQIIQKNREFILKELLSYTDGDKKELLRNKDVDKKELLSNKDGDKLDLERVFRIIKVELRFLFTFFYTKSHICSYGITTVCIHLPVVIALVFFAFHWLPHLEFVSIHFHNHSLEVGVTRAVLVIFFFLEFWKIFNVWFSNQNIVRLLCNASKKWAKKEKTSIICTRLIYMLWFVKDWFSMHLVSWIILFRPWQRKLGQYSLMESCTKVPLLAHNAVNKYFSWLGQIVRIPRAGQAGESSIKLSKEVKKAIVTSLQEILKAAADEPVRLSRYGLLEQISRHFQLDINTISSDFPLEMTDAHFILVWHIVTWLCAHRCPLKDVNDPNTNFLVATQLSNYCAYLVAFSPEILPGHPYATELLFDKAVQQAKKAKPKLIKLLEQKNADVEITMTGPEDDEVVAKGKKLYGRLMGAGFGQNRKEGWEFLAEFWAELLLYLAPSDNVAIHGEYLARGGEFITHLWALLTHAGVVSRNNCPHCMPESSPNMQLRRNNLYVCAYSIN